MNRLFPSVHFALALLLLVLSPLLLHGANKKAAASDPAIATLEKDIPTLMKQADIPGMSVAVIRKGKTYWLHNFGVKSAKAIDPVDDSTVFNVGSLSKPVFAYGVLKLVDAGKLKLDEPLAPYLPKEFTDGDPRFQQITARIVLSHRTGFPNWPGDGEKLTIHFTPGERFSYSGSGMVFLQKAIEKITGKPLNDYMQEAVFGPLGMTSSSYLWRADYDKTAATGHDSSGAPVDRFQIYKRQRRCQPRYHHARLCAFRRGGDGRRWPEAADAARNGAPTDRRRSRMHQLHRSRAQAAIKIGFLGIGLGH